MAVFTGETICPPLINPFRVDGLRDLLHVPRRVHAQRNHTGVIDGQAVVELAVDQPVGDPMRVEALLVALAEKTSLATFAENVKNAVLTAV